MSAVEIQLLVTCMLLALALYLSSRMNLRLWWVFVLKEPLPKTTFGLLIGVFSIWWRRRRITRRQTLPRPTGGDSR